MSIIRVISIINSIITIQNTLYIVYCDNAEGSNIIV